MFTVSEHRNRLRGLLNESGCTASDQHCRVLSVFERLKAERGSRQSRNLDKAQTLMNDLIKQNSSASSQDSLSLPSELIGLV